VKNAAFLRPVPAARIRLEKELPGSPGSATLKTIFGN